MTYYSRSYRNHWEHFGSELWTLRRIRDFAPLEPSLHTQRLLKRGWITKEGPPLYNRTGRYSRTLFQTYALTHAGEAILEEYPDPPQYTQQWVSHQDDKARKVDDG